MNALTECDKVQLTKTIEEEYIMLRKDSSVCHKDSIFKTLLRQSRLPEVLLQKEQGVLFQTVVRLSKRHEMNINSRRKANDAHARSEKESSFKRQSMAEKELKQQGFLGELLKEKEKSRDYSIREEEKHISDINATIKLKIREKRKKKMEEHQQLMKKLEAAQAYKQSRTLPHYSSESFFKSIKLKEKKDNDELEYSKMVQDKSFERLEESRVRLEKKEEERRANLGKIDKRIMEARNSSQERDEERMQHAINKCVKSFQGSQARIKDHLKNQLNTIQDKAKREEQKQRKVVQNYKTHALMNSKTIKQDLDKTIEKIEKAQLERAKNHERHLSNHKERRQHQSEVFKTSLKENEEFINKKVALKQKTLFKQEVLTRIKEGLEKVRQQAIMDHFINRHIQSEHTPSITTGQFR